MSSIVGLIPRYFAFWGLVLEMPAGLRVRSLGPRVALAGVPCEVVALDHDGKRVQLAGPALWRCRGAGHDAELDIEERRGVVGADPRWCRARVTLRCNYRPTRGDVIEWLGQRLPFGGESDAPFVVGALAPLTLQLTT